MNRDAAATYDCQGRKQPHRLTFLHYARSMPWLMGGFDKTVPDDFTLRVEGGEIQVACPCGHTPQLAPLMADECACGRWFFHTGLRVKCRPATTVDSAE